MSYPLPFNSCIIQIFKDGKRSTLNKAAAHQTIKLVSLMWLETCFTTNSLVDEALYLIDPSSASNSSKRNRSMKPKMLDTSMASSSASTTPVKDQAISNDHDCSSKAFHNGATSNPAANGVHYDILVANNTVQSDPPQVLCEDTPVHDRSRSSLQPLSPLAQPSHLPEKLNAADIKPRNTTVMNDSSSNALACIPDSLDPDTEGDRDDFAIQSAQKGHSLTGMEVASPKNNAMTSVMANETNGSSTAQDKHEGDWFHSDTVTVDDLRTDQCKESRLDTENGSDFQNTNVFMLANETTSISFPRETHWPRNQTHSEEVTDGSGSTNRANILKSNRKKKLLSRRKKETLDAQVSKEEIKSKSSASGAGSIEAQNTHTDGMSTSRAAPTTYSEKEEECKDTDNNVTFTASDPPGYSDGEAFDITNAKSKLIVPGNKLRDVTNNECNLKDTSNPQKKAKGAGSQHKVPNEFSEQTNSEPDLKQIRNPSHTNGGGGGGGKSNASAKKKTSSSKRSRKRHKVAAANVC